MMKNLVLIGAGNQANCVIDVIEKENKYKIVGIIDSINEVGSEKFGYTIIGRQENLIELVKQYNIDGGIISIGDNWSRFYVYNKIIEQIPNFEFINAIHPSVSIGRGVKLGKGIVAMPGCVFMPNTVIGDFTVFLTGAQIEHDCVVDDFASVSAGSVTGGFVKIGKFSAITLGVTIMDRIEIGINTVVGSGSLVVKSLPDNVLAYGNPAKIIRERKEGEKFLK